MDIEAGAVLTEELEPVSHLIYVASGDVDIATNGTVIANCRTGDYAGEVTWATGAPATAAAITRTACRCLFFNAHQLRRLANKSDAVKGGAWGQRRGRVSVKSWCSPTLPLPGVRIFRYSSTTPVLWVFRLS